MMEGYVHADYSAINATERRIAKHKSEIEFMKEKLKVLKEETFDTFCGKKVIKCKSEFFRFDGEDEHEHFNLIVDINGFNVAVSAFPKTNTNGKLYNVHYGRWHGITGLDKPEAPLWFNYKQ